MAKQKLAIVCSRWAGTKMHWQGLWDVLHESPKGAVPTGRYDIRPDVSLPVLSCNPRA